MWLILLIIVPIVALLLVGLVLTAVLALAFSIVAHLVPILLIVAGGWLLAKALHGSGGHRRTRCGGQGHGREQHRSAPSRTPQRPAQRRPVERQTASAPRRELPIDVQVKVEQIRHKVDVLLGYAGRFAPFSHDLYVVRQTAAEYLPRTIAAYLAIPGTNDPLVGSTGRTALEELRAQLALLDSRLDAITENLQQRDLDGLLANRRFLEERFGMTEHEDQVAPVRHFGGPSDSGPATQSA